MVHSIVCHRDGGKKGLKTPWDYKPHHWLRINYGKLCTMVNSCGITPAKHHSCTMINHGNVGKLECYSGYLTMVYYGILWFYHSILWFYHSVLWCFFKHSLHFTTVISKVWYHVDFRYKNMVISWYIWKYHGI